MLAATVGYSVTQIAITIVIIAAIVGLVYVALDQFGVAIANWIVRVFWIIVASFCIVWAIKLIAGMWAL